MRVHIGIDDRLYLCGPVTGDIAVPLLMPSIDAVCGYESVDCRQCLDVAKLIGKAAATQTVMLSRCK